jgi:hypothetical protein
MNPKVGAGDTANVCEPLPPQQKTLGQKISYGIAVFCYLAAAGLGVTTWLYNKTTAQDPVWASLLATTLFLISCGFVLQIIANTRLKGILTAQPETDQS